MRDVSGSCSCKSKRTWPISVEVKIDEREFADANRLLASLDERLRKKAVTESLENAARVVVQQAKIEVPQPGYPFDRPGKKPLRDTISFEIRDYPSGTFVAVVGAQYPAGAHAHLIEFGHEIWLPTPPYRDNAPAKRTGRKTDPNRFMERASDNTRSQQVTAIENTLRSHAQRVRHGT